MNKITVLGGGTGTFVVLSGLKKHGDDLAAIVSMMDSGGSTGRLRDQLGVLPPGDLRQCLLALSEAPILWRKLFLYRFENGDLKGHNFGNIFLSALEKVSGDYNEVLDLAAYVLQTRGKVIPVTFEKTHLCVEYESGKVIKGEGNIDEGNIERSKIKKAYLEPSALANKRSLERLEDTDILVIGPGDLYTSIIPVLLVDGMKDAIMKSKAKIVYILNLMTKAGQTTNYKASDHIRDITEYLGRSPDHIIINNGPVDPSVVQWYKNYNDIPVEDDLSGENSFKIIREDLIDRHQVENNKADKLTRSILRHDGEKLALIINKL